ncbi:hypothetical protein BDF19DRAFT_439863 [Syncephalis fuscata]|nr:hypothetical protein BDF19DRAFT_439863 [Syncephalis fuscata]
MSCTRESIKQLRQHLNKRCRTTISDGRVFVGWFVCVDKDKNVVVQGADEFVGTSSRFVGMVMIPGEHIVRFEVQTHPTGLSTTAHNSSDNPLVQNLTTIKETVDHYSMYQ